MIFKANTTFDPDQKYKLINPEDNSLHHENISFLFLVIQTIGDTSSDNNKIVLPEKFTVTVTLKYIISIA